MARKDSETTAPRVNRFTMHRCILGIAQNAADAKAAGRLALRGDGPAIPGRHSKPGGRHNLSCLQELQLMCRDCEDNEMLGAHALEGLLRQASALACPTTLAMLRERTESVMVV